MAGARNIGEGDERGDGHGDENGGGHGAGQGAGNPKVAALGNAAKPVEDWVTGEEPMTGAQASYLKTLSEEAGEPFDAHLTKAEASLRIDALQEKTGRGR